VSKPQIERIREAEESIRGVAEIAAQLRKEFDSLPEDNPARAELLRLAEGFEAQAQGLRDSLREWREDIN
jgi:hypothetical protein